MPEERQQVEDLVNEQIAADLPVIMKTMPIEEAKKTSAMALAPVKNMKILS